MRNIYLIIILTIMVMGFGCAKTDGTGVSGGQGGQAGSEFTACPSGGIKISTAADFKEKLQTAENLCLTASFELNEWATATKFTGKLYGQDKTLTIKSFGTGAVGLIKTIESGAQVKDLKIKLEGNLNNSGAIELGVLAQKNEGIIENVDVTGIDTVEVKGEKTVGGLVGQNYPNGEIKSSTVAVNIIGGDGTYPAGGLVGENEGRITKSHATGAVKKGNRVGGLVGLNLDMGTIEKSYAKGKVEATGEDASAGGLVGRNEGRITNSHATGNVKKGNRVGGLVGLNLDMGTIEKSYAKGKVEATGEHALAGGLVGGNHGKIEGSHATGAVSTDEARSYAGGLVGGNHGKIEGSYAKEGDVTATGEYSYAGGLVGSNEDNGSITNSYATGCNLIATNKGSLVGFNEGTITNSFALKRTGIEPVKGGNPAGVTAIDKIKATTFTDANWTTTDWKAFEADKWPTLAWQQENGFDFKACPEPKPINAKTPEEFLSHLKRNENLALENNIELENSKSIGSFNKILDGKGKMITIKSFASGAVGLIKTIDSLGQVKNLKIHLEADLEHNTKSVGVLAAENKGTIENVHVTAVSGITVKTTGERSRAGGLVGDSSEDNGSITSSYATGDVSASGNESKAGGLVGNNGGTIKNCYETGEVTGVTGVGNVGGLAAYDSGDIESSFKSSDKESDFAVGDATHIEQSDITANTFTNAGWSRSVWKNLVGGQWPILAWQP